MPRILVADDNEMIRFFYDDVIGRSGMDFEICKDGQEAFDSFLEQVADVVILDYEMPGLNGIECCKAIRETAKGVDVPIMIVSAHNDEALISRFFEAGANDYLSKPVKENLLMEKLKNHLGISE